jgi:Flp pilus assembly protein TadB
MSTADPYRPDTPARAGETRSVGEIVGDISKDMSTLIKQEMDLAKSEMKQEVGKLGKGAGMFGGAGLAGHFALFFLSFALTYLLDNWMPVELAALIVALVWGAVAAVLAMRGRKEIKEANPQLPTTQQTLKEDVQWAKTQKS